MSHYTLDLIQLVLWVGLTMWALSGTILLLLNLGD